MLICIGGTEHSVGAHVAPRTRAGHRIARGFLTAKAVSRGLCGLVAPSSSPTPCSASRLASRVRRHDLKQRQPSNSRRPPRMLVVTTTTISRCVHVCPGARDHAPTFPGCCCYARAQMLFKEIDKDSDGSLSIAELQRAITTKPRFAKICRAEG
eukprot:7382740-Prymnesium_polylepis.1